MSIEEPQNARMNHFIEWLNNIRGKETVNISDEVVADITDELKKRYHLLFNVTDLALVEKNMILDVLRQLKMYKYLEHIPYIWNRITGLPNPYISPELEETLKIMFKQLQVYYIQKNTSMLSYSYTLHKFFGILGEKQLVNQIQLIKSREKLQNQEHIWKDICEYLGWEFIPSI